MTSRPPEGHIRRWPTDRSRHWLASFLERGQHDANVVAVIAVGSAVRFGVASDDLDVVVLCHETERLKERAPIEVDLRKVNLDCLDQAIQDGCDLVIWAVRFGQPLLDPDHVWAGFVRSWKDRLPLPDSAVSMKRARSVRKRMEEMRRIGDEHAFVELKVSYLTHRAWARLASAGVQPASRPELPRQLRSLGDADLAADLETALSARAADETA